MDDIVECTVPEMAALRHPAAEAMNTEMVHLRDTMLASMWSADGRAESEGCCDTHGVIVHAKTDSLFVYLLFCIIIIIIIIIIGKQILL